jgi:hypothetical protein
MTKGEEILAECRALSTEEIIHQLKSLAADERAGLIKSLSRLSELQRRDVPQEKSCSSLFWFCVKELGYCESVAYYRAKAAHIGTKFPVLLELLESGELSIAVVAELSDHLTFENHRRLIRLSKGATRKQVERIVAELHPEPKPAERSRVIAVEVAAPSKPADEIPLLLGATAPAEPERRIELRTEHRFTVADAVQSKLEKARALLSNRIPMGDLESILDAALDALLEKLDAGSGPVAVKPPAETPTRYVPVWVKKIVRKRDGDRCAFVSSEGSRCEERRFLQYDHVLPWARGGRSDDPQNIRQLCRSHNQWAARKAGLPRPEPAASAEALDLFPP